MYMELLSPELKKLKFEWICNKLKGLRHSEGLFYTYVYRVTFFSLHANNLEP